MEMALWLEALAALAEDQRLVPSIHIRQPTTTCSSNAFLQPLQFLNLDTHVCELWKG